VEALPELGLPQAVEAFDGILEAVLQGWGEYRDDPQGQTQATDAPHGIAELMGALDRDPPAGEPSRFD
jgi:hypothetical protein